MCNADYVRDSEGPGDLRDNQNWANKLRASDRRQDFGTGLKADHDPFLKSLENGGLSGKMSGEEARKLDLSGEDARLVYGSQGGVSPDLDALRRTAKNAAANASARGQNTFLAGMSGVPNGTLLLGKNSLLGA